MSFLCWLIAFLLTFLVHKTVGYKPVFMMHGVDSNGDSMNHLVNRILQEHPGTIIHNSNAYSDDDSFAPLQEQIMGQLGQEFVDMSNTYPDGFHLIGYSQGGLLCRGLIQTYANHSVVNFIGISPPLAGYNGRMWLFGEDVSEPLKYLVFLNPITQGFYSLANLYKDPKHYDEYLRYNVFLPYLDNEIQSDMSDTYKRGFTRCKKIITIGGPDDGMITPWQSSYFSYVDANGTVIDFRDSKAYKEDWFGLKTMDEEGKLVIYIREGFRHADWVLSDEIIDNYILPHLN